ncbi:MAG: glucose-6-phosphate isomerase, partial [Marivivens sp.]|nr:glucose-6-phosphate isomerase [Marivivens sp.]NCW68588.1 glucose-6-phosphate isomerase [Marivivens sp.]
MFDDLKSHYASIKDRRIESMLDARRADDFSAQAGDMLFDYSKTNIDSDARDMLIGLLETTGVAARRDAMFAGEKINETEGRAVLHTALRNLDGGAVKVDGQDVIPAVRDTLARMEAFAADVREGRYTGQGGKITDVINIGIGGSDLGPAMAYRALAPYADGPRCH